MFKIFFTKDSQKQYDKLPKTVQPRIAKALATLSWDPFKGKKLGGELAGLYTMRAWPYRIIYTVDQIQQEVIVTSIQHRQGAYK